MRPPAPDLPALLDAIRRKPDRGFHWLALAAWLCGRGRYDEAAAVRVFWPQFRDYILAGHSAHLTLRRLARQPALWGQRARQFEHQRRAHLLAPA